MKVVYRLVQDWNGMLEGWCVMEGQYKGMYYLDRPLFEQINEDDRSALIEFDDKKYCIENNIECVLFYTEKELERFKIKIS